MNELDVKVELIKTLQNLGKTPEEIKKDLHLTKNPAYYIEKQAKNSESWDLETVEAYLKDHIDKKVHDPKKWNGPKIKRFVAEGKLEALPKTYKTEPYRFSEEAVKRFVEQENMTAEDWRQKALELEKRVVELEQSNNGSEEEIPTDVAELRKMVKALKSDNTRLRKAAGEQPRPKDDQKFVAEVEQQQKLEKDQTKIDEFIGEDKQ